MRLDGFIEISKGFWVLEEYAESFKAARLGSMEQVRDFNAGEILDKKGLASFRKRIRFELNEKILYLKLYNRAPIKIQLRNWIDHRERKTLAQFDMGPADIFSRAEIKTPKTVAYGKISNGIFETASLIVTENIDDAKPLEKTLPPFFDDTNIEYDISKQKNFVKELGLFAKRFHDLGLRHRDFYLCHIFWGQEAGFYLIDLQRVFKPILSQRFRIKDIAQLFYSSPASVYSKTMKLRCYLAYAGKNGLDNADKKFIAKVFAKAQKMKRHDIKKSRAIPFEN